MGVDTNLFGINSHCNVGICDVWFPVCEAYIVHAGFKLVGPSWLTAWSRLMCLWVLLGILCSSCQMLRQPLIVSSVSLYVQYVCLSAFSSFCLPRIKEIHNLNNLTMLLWFICIYSYLWTPPTPKLAENISIQYGKQQPVKGRTWFDHFLHEHTQNRYVTMYFKHWKTVIV